MKEAKKMSRKRISRQMIMFAAEISSKFGVRVVLNPDGTMIFEGSKDSPSEAEPDEDARLRSWDDWEPSPIQPELDHREIRLFELIGRAGVGVPMSAQGSRNCGPATCLKLIARGYAEAGEDEYTVMLTHKGGEDWRKLESYRKKMRGV